MSSFRWQRRFPIRPWCERLEERTAPAVFIIAPGDVYGPNGLVAAITTANGNGQSNTVQLAAGSLYTLSKVDNFWYGPDGLPPISSDLTIDGSGAILQRDVNLGAATPFRVFFVSGGVSNPLVLAAGHLTLHNLTLQGGLALGGKGGDGGFAGGGGAGLGGAIFNQGTLDLDSVTLTGNAALGGAGGGQLVNGGFGGGGGLGGAGGNATVSGAGGGGFRGAGQPNSAGSNGGTGLEGTEGGSSSAAGGAGGVSSFGGNGAAATPLAGGGGGGFVNGQNAVGVMGSGFGGLGSSGDGGSGSSNAAGANEAGGGGAFGGGGAGAVGLNSGGGGGGVGGGGGGGSINSGGGGGFGAGGGSFGQGGFGGGGGSLVPGGFAGGSGGNDPVGAGGGGGAGLGGAVFTMYGSLHAVNSTFAGNTAQGGDGGTGAGQFAIGVVGGSGFGSALFNLNGAVTITNCTLAANTVVPGKGNITGQADGDAVFNLAFGNQITDGSAVTAALTLTNTIVAGSSGTQHDLVNTEVDGKQLNNAVVTATSPNLVVASASMGNQASITGMPLTGNPQLGPLQNNGGPTPTMELLAGSPAFNVGTSIGAPATDQRGVPRGAAISLGAYQATADHFAVNGFPPVVTAGQTANFTVTALDPFGQTAFGYTGTAQFSATGASTVPAPSPLTNGTGTFPATLFTAGTQSIAATDGTLSGSQAGILVLPAAAAQITLVGGSGQSTQVQQPFPLPLQGFVTDAFNNPITGANVAFTVPAAGPSGTFAALATVATVNGLATAPMLTANTIAGNFLVTATLPGVGTVNFALMNTPGNAANIAVFAGTPQSTTVGTAYAVPLQAQVKDAFGNVVPGAGVAFAVPANGPSGTFASNATVTSNAAGVATAPTLVANGTAGSFVVTAALTNNGSKVPFNLTNTPAGPATIVAIAGTPQSATVGTTYATALQAQLRDAFGNVVPGVGVVFTAPGSGPSGMFAGNATVLTDAAGVATAPAFTANQTAGTFTVTASAGSAGSAAFNLSNTPGTAAVLTLVAGTPQSTTVNSAFATPLQVKVTDAFGNAITGAGITFAVPAAGASGTFAANPIVATAANGIATAPALTANTIAGSFMATAALAGVGTVNFNLTNAPGNAANITVFAGTPQSTIVGTPFPQLLQAQVKDAFGNVVPGASVTFAAPANGPSGTFAANATVTTDAAGVATAPSLVANGTAGSFTATATLAGLASVSFNLTTLAGNFSLLVAAAGTPQSAVVTKAYATALQVRVTDTLGNPVPGISVTFAAPANGPSGTFAGATTVMTNAAGLATAPAFNANTIAGNFVVTATVNGNLTANFILTNLPGAAVQIVAISGSGQTTMVNTPFAIPLQVQVTDAFGNAITGANVTFTAPVAGASGTFAAGSTVATMNGIATAPLTANTVVGGFKVTASVPGAGSVSFTLTNKAGPVASITVVDGPGQSASTGSPFPKQLEVLAKDAFGNPVCGASVTFTAPAAGASGTFNGGGTVIADANGLAFAPVLVANGTPGNFQVTATSNGFSTSLGLTNTAPLAMSNAALRPRVVRRSATLEVSVGGAVGVATGNVELFDVCEGRQRLLCTLRLANGQAVRKVKLRPGTHRLWAMYGGDQAYQGSSAKVMVQIR